MDVPVKLNAACRFVISTHAKDDFSTCFVSNFSGKCCIFSSFPTDWSGLSPESRMLISPSWGFESTIHTGQPFQGSLLPMATGNSHTVHHYAFPQTWHHAVTPQNFG